MPPASSTSSSKPEKPFEVPEGYALVPLNPTPEAIGAWHRVKNGFHYEGEPAPQDTSCYAAYRALVQAAKITPDNRGST